MIRRRRTGANLDARSTTASRCPVPTPSPRMATGVVADRRRESRHRAGATALSREGEPRPVLRVGQLDPVASCLEPKPVVAACTVASHCSTSSAGTFTWHSPHCTNDGRYSRCIVGAGPGLFGFYPQGRASSADDSSMSQGSAAQRSTCHLASAHAQSAAEFPHDRSRLAVRRSFEAPRCRQLLCYHPALRAPGDPERRLLRAYPKGPVATMTATPSTAPRYRLFSGNGSRLRSEQNQRGPEQRP